MSLPKNVTPLYFPVICIEDRKSVQEYLREKKIYAPIVWPKPSYITERINEADFFYEHLLCIPCDQRYGIEEMKYIVECCNKI